MRPRTEERGLSNAGVLKLFLENGTEPGDYERLGGEWGMGATGAKTLAAGVYRLGQRYRELVRTAKRLRLIAGQNSYLLWTL